MSSEKTCAVSGCDEGRQPGSATPLCERHADGWEDSRENERAWALRRNDVYWSALHDFCTRTGLEELRDREAAQEAK